MPHPIIDSDECSACGACAEACPNGVLEISGDTSSVVDDEACTGCGVCMEECPMGAILDIADD